MKRERSFLRGRTIVSGPAGDYKKAYESCLALPPPAPETLRSIYAHWFDSVLAEPITPQSEVLIPTLDIPHNVNLVYDNVVCEYDRYRMSHHQFPDVYTPLASMPEVANFALSRASNFGLLDIHRLAADLGLEPPGAWLLWMHEKASITCLGPLRSLAEDVAALTARWIMFKAPARYLSTIGTAIKNECAIGYAMLSPPGQDGRAVLYSPPSLAYWMFMGRALPAPTPKANFNAQDRTRLLEYPPNPWWYAEPNLAGRNIKPMFPTTAVTDPSLGLLWGLAFLLEQAPYLLDSRFPSGLVKSMAEAALQRYQKFSQLPGVPQLHSTATAEAYFIALLSAKYAPSVPESNQHQKAQPEQRPNTDTNLPERSDSGNTREDQASKTDDLASERMRDTRGEPSRKQAIQGDQESEPTGQQRERESEEQARQQTDEQTSALASKGHGAGFGDKHLDKAEMLPNIFETPGPKNKVAMVVARSLSAQSSNRERWTEIMKRQMRRRIASLAFGHDVASHAYTVPTFQRRNRMVSHLGLTVPADIPDQRQCIHEALVVIDTSGSMEDVAGSAAKVAAEICASHGVVVRGVLHWGRLPTNLFKNAEDALANVRAAGGTDLAAMEDLLFCKDAPIEHPPLHTSEFIRTLEKALGGNNVAGTSSLIAGLDSDSLALLRSCYAGDRFTSSKIVRQALGIPFTDLVIIISDFDTEPPWNYELTYDVDVIAVLFTRQDVVSTVLKERHNPKTQAQKVVRSAYKSVGSTRNIELPNISLADVVFVPQ